MVGAEDFCVYDGILDTRTQAVADDEIVNAPASVLLSGLEAVAPPRIGHLLRIFPTESVGEAAAEQKGELLALLVGETRIAAVGLRVLDVYLLVRHVQVAAEDDRLLRVKLLEIFAEVILPRHSVVQTLQAVLRVGRIAAHQEEVSHLQRDDTPLVVVRVYADAIAHVQRLMTGEDGRARIAFLLGRVPIRLIAFKLNVELAGLHLRLLKAEEIGIQLTENISEAFALAGAQAVHIPTNQFHGRLVVWFVGAKLRFYFFFCEKLRLFFLPRKQTEK